MKTSLKFAGVGAVWLALTGCSTLGYYAQSVRGQFDLLARSRPIDELVADPAVGAPLRHKLEQVLAIREFASRDLGLPDNDSYRSYVDLHRPYVVWNVFAAPEFSTRPRQWCFPIVGCVAYRGYFAEAAARRYAAALADKGFDVYVGGVAAYSTLGWFDDPVLSTVISQPEDELAGLIFHELAHQVLYVDGDTAFNESFATVVELEGARRWFAARNDPAAMRRFEAKKRRTRQVVDLLLEYRNRLQQAYAEPRDDAWKRTRKRELFAALKRAYEKLRQDWGGVRTYDRWFAQNLNNAHLASVGTYYQHVDALRALLHREGDDLRRFYAAAKRLGRLEDAERQAELAKLAGG